MVRLAPGNGGVTLVTNTAWVLNPLRNRRRNLLHLAHTHTHTIIWVSLPFVSSFCIAPEVLVTGIQVHETQTRRQNYARDKIKKIRRVS